MPEPQPGHDPFPAWPAGHAEQLCLLLETAHPAPDLHDVLVCDVLSCHVLAGHAPQTTFADAEHADVCFLPAPHVPQLLQLAWLP